MQLRAAGSTAVQHVAAVRRRVWQRGARAAAAGQRAASARTAQTRLLRCHQRAFRKPTPLIQATGGQLRGACKRWLNLLSLIYE